MDDKNLRRVGRIKLDVPITITVYGREVSCMLDNISTLGAGISGASFLNMSIGQKVSLKLPEVGKMNGQVRWTGLSGAGISFDTGSEKRNLLRSYISSLESLSVT